MDDISKRLKSLTPEQRALLELRLKRQGLTAATPAPAAAPAPADDYAELPDWKTRRVERGLGFTLYFFSDDGSRGSADKYRLVLESAKFADARGFRAVWTPERHFQDFGGLYPNPSVLSAALAMITERVQIRAGSVALPLHHPVRVAEEWSVVDNLSRGRAAVSFASGWHPDDFILAPGNYAERKAVMYRHIELVRRLWAGESVSLPGPDGREVTVRILPRPIQETLPVWVTSAGSAETWVRAGEIGANVLAALIGYTFDELKDRIDSYRAARARAGHDPSAGLVSVMVHTFVGQSNAAVKELVRAPFTHYLGTYFKQYENVRAGAEEATAADRETIAAAAFEHYFGNLTLMGTPAKCARVVEQLTAAGADEVACLVDFGVEHEAVLESLQHLDELREHYDVAAVAAD